MVHHDRDKALACLQRRNTCEAQIKMLKTQQLQHDQLKQDMQSRLIQMQSQLTEAKRQQVLLRNRSDQAEVERIACQLNDSGRDDFEEIFTRWEEKLIANELNYSDLHTPATNQDTLETEFLAQERQTALNAQLDELLRLQKKGENHD